MASEPIIPEFGGLLKIGLYYLLPATLLYIVNSLFFRVAKPDGVPYIREPPGKKSFSWKTRLAYLTDCESLFREAYQNYSKKGKAVILPSFGLRDELVLPVSSMRWALAQPETVLSADEAFVEIDQPDYILGHTKYIADNWPGLLVKRNMNAVLETLVAAMNNELRMVVAQASSRFTVELPLCRNAQYLKDCLDAIDGCVINAGVSSGTPPMFRPLVGPLAGLKTRLAQRKVQKHLEPIYQERLQTLQYSQDDPQHVEPQDHLQMMLRYAQKERPHELYDLENISRRLTVANFGSMHQTSIQVTNMLLNILASDAEYNTITVLRDEVAQVMGTDNHWSKAKVSRMIRADSVARETLRLNSFGGRAILRKVVADGVETDAGVKLPKGTVLSFLSQPAHVDEATYEEPLKYDPFRFSRVREATHETTKGSTLSFVSTGPDYLAFSHGRHACPGRFLVDFELKMIIAYVLTNYDIKFPEKYGGTRPENKWMTEALLPPDGVQVLVKRRKATL